MATAVNTYSSTWLSTDQSAHTVSQRLRRYASTSESEAVVHYMRYNTFTPPTSQYDSQGFVGPTTDWVNYNVTIPCDTTHYYRAYGEFASSSPSTKLGITKSFLTYAVDPTVGTPSLSGATSSTVTVDGSWTPATVETTVNILVQYKKTADSTWSEEAGDGSTGTGYTSRAITQVLVSGLDAETSYDFRLVCYRSGTSNTTQTYYGSTATTSTIADVPTVTTDAATNISSATATLNATVDHNTVNGNLSWRYDTSDPGTADDSSGTEVDYVSNPITADGSGSYNLIGLTASQTYYFWAIYDPTGAEATVYGSILNFTLDADPDQTAEDSCMQPVFFYDRKWAVDTTIFFTLPQPAATGPNRIYDGADVWAAGETKLTGIVYDDDSTPTITAEDDAASNPTRVASTNLYRLDLTAGEMTHDEVYITIVDNTPAHRDMTLVVRTHQMLGTIDVDATNKATNTTAVTYSGNGTGSGLECVGGDNDGAGIRGVFGDHVQNYGTLVSGSNVTCELDNSTASAIADYYNGSIILFHTGTGAGQSRVITDYDGAYTCTLNKALATPLGADTEYIIIPGPDSLQISPGVELAALPTIASTYADMLQFCFQRFAYGRTQTATAFTMFEDDDATPFATAAVDDDQSTQTHNIMVDA